MRTMYDILRSCLFTLAACVYRAIHPNIPNPEFGFWRRLRVTIKITFCALMAPELIILWALNQWFGAKMVAERINEAVERNMKPNPGFKWSQTHGQFLQMGGFARRDTREILTSEALVDLIQAGIVDLEDLQITEKQINDKSKGDALSKGLVAFQTMWFIFECIARLQQGLILLEVEVVTLAFSTLNAVTYALWWYKPLNVLCPIYICIQPEPVSATLSPTPMDTTTIHIQTPSAEGDTTATTHGDEGIMATVWGIVKIVVKGIWGMLNDAVVVVKSEIDGWGWWLPFGWLIVRPSTAFWKLILQPLTELFLGRNSFSSEAGGPESGDRILSLASAVGMVFGAIHFISWDSTFPTHTQLILWRASSIILVVQPFLMMLTGILGTISSRLPQYTQKRVNIELVNSGFGFLSMFLGPIPYIFARFCVIVLAFLTLRDLPLAAFENVSWTSYIPHL